MLGSVFSGRRDYTKVPQRKPVQNKPYISDVPGFNTRFSRYEIEQKEKFQKPLTADEEQFLCYVRALENVYKD